jgi:hypothetical protein
MMNPGIPEEVGSTTRTMIDALKGQPAVLALTLANIMLLIFMFYALSGAAKSRELLVGQILQNSNAIHTMLQQRAVACPDAGPTL